MGSRMKAFTLIELLIVVAIIGILAAIAIPNFLEAQVRAKVAAVRSDHRNIATALEAYQVDHGSYPAKFPDWARTPTSACKCGNIRYETIGPDTPCDLLTTPIAYMSDFPMDVFQAGERIDPYSGWHYYYYWPCGRKPNPPFFLLVYPPTYWMLVSLGPNKIFEPASGPPWPALEFHQWAHYDSSNGTISYGDLVRMGP